MIYGTSPKSKKQYMPPVRARKETEMRKIKICLDSSVASMFGDSERGIVTKKFFELVVSKPDTYEIISSPVLQEEISRTKEPEKKKNILERLQSLPVTEVKKNEEAENLAWIYVIEDVLTDNHLDDLRYISYAVVTHCNYVVSWNMRHLSNVDTIERVNNYNRNNNLSLVIITPPTLFTGE